jgi:hypothetical protein
MKKRRVFRLAFVLPLIVAGCTLLRGPLKEEEPANVDLEVISTLRPGHPRLMLTDDDLASLRALLKTDPELQGLVEKVVAEATDLLDKPTVEYIVIGPRLLSQSRACLMKVYALALAYRLTDEMKFADRAKVELLAAAAFKDWNPSHFLDTAEMSHAFGIGYDWLYDELGEDRDTIRAALIEKGLKPGLLCYRGEASYGWWIMRHHNWNQVCNGGLLVGALAVADEHPEMAAEIVAGAIESLPRAMASYAPDGGWAEGPGYWHYATRYNAYALAALESALGTDFGLSESPGFADAGLFRIYSIGPHGKTFNYADAGSGAGPAEEMFWLARKFDRPIYAWHQREMLRHGSPNALDVFWYDPRGETPDTAQLPLDSMFTGVDVAFLRSRWHDPNAIYVGFKGGDNEANHSHLDLGTFVLDADGVRWAVDLGSDDYNMPGYFGKNRWTYYRLRTESHNTLVINGDNQNPKAKAPLIAFESTPELAYAIADLTAAYEGHADRVRRTIALIDRSHVLVRDDLDLKDTATEIVWGMVTPADVELDGAKAILRQKGKTLTARIVSPKGAVFEVISTTPPPPQKQNEGARKLAIRVAPRENSLRITVLLSPGSSGDVEISEIPHLLKLVVERM